jgi:putative membrane protein
MDDPFFVVSNGRLCSRTSVSVRIDAKRSDLIFNETIRRNSMSKEMGMSNTDKQRCRTAIWTVAAIEFAVSLHPARANAQGTAPTDPQIVGIALGADQIDIAYAKLAMSKTQDKQVIGFAQQMINDHTAVSKSVGALAAKLNVTPADSETSGSLKTQAEQMTQKLQGLSGKEFEKAYIDNEVAYHQAVINATKTVLVPSARNAELKSALQGAVPLFEGHLAHAQRVQSAIEGGGMQSSSGMGH